MKKTWQYLGLRIKAPFCCERRSPTPSAAPLRSSTSYRAWRPNPLICSLNHGSASGARLKLTEVTVWWSRRGLFWRRHYHGRRLQLLTAAGTAASETGSNSQPPWWSPAEAGWPSREETAAGRQLRWPPPRRSHPGPSWLVCPACHTGNKKLSYRGDTARRAMSVEIKSPAAQLYEKSSIWKDLQ